MGSGYALPLLETQILVAGVRGNWKLRLFYFSVFYDLIRSVTLIYILRMSLHKNEVFHQGFLQ